MFNPKSQCFRYLPYDSVVKQYLNHISVFPQEEMIEPIPAVSCYLFLQEKCEELLFLFELVNPSTVHLPEQAPPATINNQRIACIACRLIQGWVSGLALFVPIFSLRIPSLTLKRKGYLSSWPDNTIIEINWLNSSTNKDQISVRTPPFFLINNHCAIILVGCITFLVF